MKHYVHNLFALGMMGLSFQAKAQDTLILDEVTVQERSFKIERRGLYEGNEIVAANVRGFSQLAIFSGSTTDFWTSEGKDCISSGLVGESSPKALNIKWNQANSACSWVGMGFGWDAWMSKDMGYVLDTLAIELKVRTTGEPTTNLPWAFCLEDYSGGQAWLGYQRKFLQADIIDAEWRTVLIPLSLFPMEQFDVDATSIKQMMVQVFGDGDVEIQSITLVPFAGQTQNSVEAPLEKKVIDGKDSDWNQNAWTNIDGGHRFQVSHDSDRLYFVAIVKDNSPRENKQVGAQLWNGDAIEIAFSTNPKADKKRQFLMLSDQHIGINCGPNPYVWNWKVNEQMKDVLFSLNNNENGYILEMAIPISSFKNFELVSGTDLDLEIAIDLGSGDKRDLQVKWNSLYEEGFHTNPSLWGELKIK